MPLTDDTLAARIVQARRLRGLTQQQVADLAGITKRAYQSIEYGVTLNPRMYTLIQLCEVLAVKIERLTEGM